MIQNIKTQTQNSLNEDIADLKNSYKHCTQTYWGALNENIQRLCFVVDKPESAYLIRAYKKQSRNLPMALSAIEQLPDIWYGNLKLYTNKIHLEFLSISLRYRIATKLDKFIDELTQKVETKLTSAIKQSKEKAEDCARQLTIPELSNSAKLLDELKNMGVRSSFDAITKDLNEIVKELPEEVKVNDLSFFNDIESGKFPLSESRTIDFRRRVEFYLGSELVSKSIESIEDITVLLRETATRLVDKLTLAAFNVENSLNNDEFTEEQQRLKIDEAFKSLLNTFQSEEHKLKRSLQNFDITLNNHLKAAIEPIHSMLFAHYDKAFATKRKGLRKWKAPKRISNAFGNLKKFFNKQLVGFLYSQSEGIMLAQRVTSFEKEHKISNQAIQEMLQGLLPNGEVIKKLPFYYTSLFSGSTAINKDLWVGRKKELAEAEKIVERFKAGYSGALLITGNRNEGKTSFSKYITQKFFNGYTVHSVKGPKGGSSNPNDFELALQKALNISTHSSQLLSSIHSKRVIIINDLELWWDRHEVGGYVVAEIKRIIEEYGKQAFFIVNCGTTAYRLINKLYNLDSSFMGHISCEPFDARELKEMIITRHRTGGLKLSYRGKFEESLSEWNYARLFNKYFHISRGNPGFTSLLWLSNITRVVGKTIYIKAPSAPSLNQLSDISDDVWMVILQLALHRRSTIERLARVLRLSNDETKKLIISLQRSGLIEERFPEVFAINPYLEPFLMEKVKEKGFI